MKTYQIIPITITTLSLMLGGCASSNYKNAEHTSSSVQKAAQGVRKGNGQIDAVLFALSSLVNEPGADLKSQYEKLDDAVAKLDSLSKEIGHQTIAMREKGATYFQHWDLELAKIQNEDIRSRSLDRKNVVAARFDQVRADYAKTNADFIPFMSDMKDIRTALSTDLTMAGVGSIKGTANRAHANVVPLRESLSRLETDFKALGVELSTANPGAASL